MSTWIQSAQPFDLAELEQFSAQQDPNDRVDWGTALKRMTGNVLVAKERGRDGRDRVVGVLDWEKPVQERAEVRRLQVAEANRRAGIGGRLARRGFLDMFRSGATDSTVRVPRGSQLEQFLGNVGYARLGGDYMRRDLTTLPREVAQQLQIRTALPGDSHDLQRVSGVTRTRLSEPGMPPALQAQQLLRRTPSGIELPPGFDYDFRGSAAPEEADNNIIVADWNGNLVGLGEWWNIGNRSGTEQRAFADTPRVDGAISSEYGVRERIATAMMRDAATKGHSQLGLINVDPRSLPAFFVEDLDREPGRVNYYPDISAFDERQRLAETGFMLDEIHRRIDEDPASAAEIAHHMLGDVRQSAADTRRRERAIAERRYMAPGDVDTRIIDPSLADERVVSGLPGIIRHLDETGNEEQARSIAEALAGLSGSTRTDWATTRHAVARTVNQFDTAEQHGLATELLKRAGMPEHDLQQATSADRLQREHGAVVPGGDEVWDAPAAVEYGTLPQRPVVGEPQVTIDEDTVAALEGQQEPEAPLFSFRSPKQGDSRVAGRWGPDSEGYKGETLWAARLQSPNALVAEGRDGRPIGAATWTGGSETEPPAIEFLYVAPEARRQGAGSGIIDEVSQRLANQGQSDLRIDPGDDEAGREFLAKRGWTANEDGTLSRSLEGLAERPEVEAEQERGTEETTLADTPVAATEQEDLAAPPQDKEAPYGWLGSTEGDDGPQPDEPGQGAKPGPRQPTDTPLAQEPAEGDVAVAPVEGEGDRQRVAITPAEEATGDQREREQVDVVEGSSDSKRSDRPTWSDAVDAARRGDSHEDDLGPGEGVVRSDGLYAAGDEVGTAVEVEPEDGVVARMPEGADDEKPGVNTDLSKLGRESDAGPVGLERDPLGQPDSRGTTVSR